MYVNSCFNMPSFLPFYIYSDTSINCFGWTPENNQWYRKTEYQEIFILYRTSSRTIEIELLRFWKATNLGTIDWGFIAFTSLLFPLIVYVNLSSQSLKILLARFWRNWPVNYCKLVGFQILQLILSCRIRGFHSSDYEECHLLGYYAMWLL
jgi:hypothetical protein